jgi:hypothetical protein
MRLIGHGERESTPEDPDEREGAPGGHDSASHFADSGEPSV